MRTVHTTFRYFGKPRTLRRYAVPQQAPIIGATNRPGRFDRKVAVTLPDSKGRQKILEVHSKNMVLNANIDIEKIARMTTGCSGADLMNITNEAAIFAARSNRKVVCQEDMNKAYEKISIGLPRQVSLEIIAYHEAGHSNTIRESVWVFRTWLKKYPLGFQDKFHWK